MTKADRILTANNNVANRKVEEMVLLKQSASTGAETIIDHQKKWEKML